MLLKLKIYIHIYRWCVSIFVIRIIMNDCAWRIPTLQYVIFLIIIYFGFSFFNFNLFFNNLAKCFVAR